MSVRGFVAWTTVFLLGLVAVEVVLWLIGLTQFRRDAGLAYVLFVTVDCVILQWLNLKEPWFWFKLFNGIVLVLCLIGLAYRLFTGDWNPLIPEYTLSV